MSTYLVFLRRPNRREDPRDDPFWEFGSFGLTGCHRSNLLRPGRCPIHAGDKLAFIQGGGRGLTIVGLTPPLSEVRTLTGRHGARLELLWDCAYRPVPYDQAPVLMDNGAPPHNSMFNEVQSLVEGVARSTPCGRVASRLRSTKTPASGSLEREITDWFDGPQAAIAAYPDAVMSRDRPWHRGATSAGWAHPGIRRARYEELLRSL